MTAVIKKNANSPDETRPFVEDSGAIRVVELEGATVGRATFEPGWQWSKHVKPIAGTDSCQAHHLGYVASGTMTVRMDDGEETTFGPEDFVAIPPGHDAWVVGDEPCVMVDWGGVAKYAKPD